MCEPKFQKVSKDSDSEHDDVSSGATLEDTCFHARIAMAKSFHLFEKEATDSATERLGKKYTSLSSSEKGTVDKVLHDSFEVVESHVSDRLEEYCNVVRKEHNAKKRANETTTTKNAPVKKKKT